MMAKVKNPKFIGIIPARYGSTRFPGKPLVKILGKSLIQRTYENSLLCKMLDDVIVATDDDRIYKHVIDFGGQAVMTSEAHPTGTDRLAEVLQTHYKNKSLEIIVNIQGDEPTLEPSVIQAIIEILNADPQAVMSTAVVKIDSEEEAYSTSVNKCVIDQDNNALYFSRSLIPGNKSGKYRSDLTYYKHLGIYAYRPQFLLKYATLPQTPLQLAEDLEQLKVLENGYRLKAAVVKSSCIGVDKPEDIQKVEQYLCKQNTFL
jgi:3-deoxy-manno-octulosonate cytidylyltransferase (CMP-KDO synthetase)